MVNAGVWLSKCKYSYFLSYCEAVYVALLGIEIKIMRIFAAENHIMNWIMNIKTIFIYAAVCALAACSSKVSGTNSDGGADSVAQSEQGLQMGGSAKTVSLKGYARESSGVIDLNVDDVLVPNCKLDKVTVIDFNATWCMPCKKFAPVFDQVATEISDADFVSVDIDKAPKTATAFGVQSVPTVVILDESGKELRRYVGIADIMPAEEFSRIVKDCL